MDHRSRSSLPEFTQKAPSLFILSVLERNSMKWFRNIYIYIGCESLLTRAQHTRKAGWRITELICISLVHRTQEGSLYRAFPCRMLLLTRSWYAYINVRVYAWASSRERNQMPKRLLCRPFGFVRRRVIYLPSFHSRDFLQRKREQ